MQTEKTIIHTVNKFIQAGIFAVNLYCTLVPGLIGELVPLDCSQITVHLLIMLIKNKHWNTRVHTSHIIISPTSGSFYFRTILLCAVNVFLFSVQTFLFDMANALLMESIQVISTVWRCFAVLLTVWIISCHPSESSTRPITHWWIDLIS